MAIVFKAELLAFVNVSLSTLMINFQENILYRWDVLYLYFHITHSYPLPRMRWKQQQTNKQTKKNESKVTNNEQSSIHNNSSINITFTSLISIFLLLFFYIQKSLDDDYGVLEWGLEMCAKKDVV